jgi:hypothetical protein
MTERPKWEAHDARERIEMVQWTHLKLNEWQAAEASGKKRTAPEYRAWLEADGPEIYYAEHGNIEPLRKKYSRLAPFLIAPKKLKKEPRTDAITTAVAAVKKIREIWRAEYGLVNRPDGQVSAIEIAALWMQECGPGEGQLLKAEGNIEVLEFMEAIEKRMKPSGPSGKKKVSRAE